MSRTRLGTVIVGALFAAIAIWLGYLYLTLQPGRGIAPGNEAWLVGLVLGGCVLDGLVAARALRGPVGAVGLTWLALRTLLSVVGFLFFTLPLYALAFFALTRAPRADPRTDPTRPHAYRPISSGWFGALTPVGWSRNLLGASQLGQTRCVVCREAMDDPIHGPDA